MFRVLSFLTTQHDWRPVALAGAVCLVASLGTINLFWRAHERRGHARRIWLVMASAVAGCGIWTTHFVAMLGYDPAVAIRYDVGLTLLSLASATGIAGLGLIVSEYGRRSWAKPLGGAIVGCGIASMNLGTWALRVPGHVTWSSDLVLASILLAVGLGAAGWMVAARRNDATATISGALLLTVAVLSHHFVAIGAVNIVPDQAIPIDGFAFAPPVLGAVVAGAIIAVLGVSLVSALMDRVFSDKVARLDTALNNITQGAILFDRTQRLVICNSRFREMFDLSADVVTPGRSLRDVIYGWAQTGTLHEDPEQYLKNMLETVAAGKYTRTLSEPSDKRKIAIVTRVKPLPDGGWVTTYADITPAWQAQQELALAHAEAEQAKNRLTEAFDVVPAGLVLFDAENRYVLWNRRYAEIYNRPDIQVGARFEDTLRADMARKVIPEAIGREEKFLAERMAQFNKPSNSYERQLTDGRWLRVEERRTADGGNIGVRIDITDVKQREASFRLLFDSNPLPMFVFDRDTLTYLAVNDAAIEHYGYSRQQFLSMSVLDLRPQEDWARVKAAIEKPARPLESLWQHVKADGTVIDVSVFSVDLQYEGRRARLLAAVDITKARQAESELRRTREFLDTVIENVPAMLFVKEPVDHKYMLINRAGEKLLGMTRGELIGKNDFDLLPKEEAEISFARERDVLHAGRTEVLAEEEIRTKDNGVRLVTTRRLPILDEKGAPQYLLGVAEDITERKRAEARIAHLAHHDALTELPNRAAFTAHLARTIEQFAADCENFALMFLDLDRFKEINDIFGHAVGDALLQELARRLQEVAEGAFLARLGGDEFTFVVESGPQPEAAAALADRLIAATAQEFVLGDHSLRTGLSIGIAVFPNDGADASTLLSNADAALYRAKAEGRGIFRFFEADMDMHLHKRRALRRDLQLAIPNNELLIHYQPQARMNSEITGFEALLRWHNPSRGLVPSNEFIPIAEESGLILPIGEWVLRESCREAASWPRRLQIAVNLSPVQFRHGDLPAMVHAILLETGLSPDRLELEITESVLIGDFARAVAILRRIKALGVRIAMDDFGTGYSSLSYLQSFPFDKIKIDRSFISNLDRNAQSGAIVRAVIGLGRGLELPVLAEGVETKGQLDFLAGEACNEIQGYLLGRPAPIEQYAELVGRHSMSEPRQAVAR
jgi:diguanylate cyclase (GGDEF)-like protein/PAS domain S-box-containing protein